MLDWLRRRREPASRPIDGGLWREATIERALEVALAIRSDLGIGSAVQPPALGRTP
jgi:hypothetical protein